MSMEPSVDTRYERLLDAESESTDQDRLPLYHEVAGQPPINGATAPQAVISMGPGSVPPSYKAATSLPTYNDVEEEKEHEARLELLDEMFGLSAMKPEPDEPQIDGMAIGGDCTFIFVFLLSFFLNWFGFAVGYCCMNSFAAKYGALAGLATSVIRWLVYIKNADCCNKYLVREHAYVFWILNAVAFLMLLKGLVGWLSVRRFRNTPPNCISDQTAPKYTMFE